MIAPLKEKHRIGKSFKATKHTKQGNPGGKGKAGKRRARGWRKHAKGHPANTAVFNRTPIV